MYFETGSLTGPQSSLMRQGCPASPRDHLSPPLSTEITNPSSHNHLFPWIHGGWSSGPFFCMASSVTDASSPRPFRSTSYKISIYSNSWGQSCLLLHGRPQPTSHASRPLWDTVAAREKHFEHHSCCVSKTKCLRDKMRLEGCVSSEVLLSVTGFSHAAMSSLS